MNRGNSHYQRGWYARAKEEFLRARTLKDDYPSLNTQLLRTYRKLYKNAIERSRWGDSYDVIVELFETLPADVTNTDRRQHNTVIEKLRAKESDFRGRPMQLEGGPRAKSTPVLAEIERLDGKQCRLHLGPDSGARSKGEKPINWSDRFFTATGIICYKAVYDQEKGGYTSYHIRVLSHDGDTLFDLDVPIEFYRVKVCVLGDLLIGHTEDLRLLLCTLDGRRMGERPIGREAESNKYHVRCVDLSGDGKRTLFTVSTRAYWMDEGLQTLRTWVMPPPEGYDVERRESDSQAAEVERALSALELHGSPTREEIKKRFRFLALKYHPDRNPEDPLAEDRMKRIIGAYRILCDEDLESALTDVGDIEYYYKIMDEIVIENKELGGSFMLTISMRGPGDWIYASHVTERAERIYLGCYSGRIYCVNEEGRVLKTYVTDDTVRRIEERAPYLYIETSFGLYVIRDDRVMNHIEIGTGEFSFFAGWGFSIKKGLVVSLYEPDGALIGNVRFSREPREIIPTHGGILVDTTKERFAISVS